MKAGNVVRWSPTNSRSRIGLVMSGHTGLWLVWFPKSGHYEIEEHYLEVVSELR